MLVQSTGEELYILPALPREKWVSGFAKGLRARGGVTVNIRWSEGFLHEVDVWSLSDHSCLNKLRYGGSSVAVHISPGKVHTFNSELRLVKTRQL